MVDALGCWRASSKRLGYKLHKSALGCKSDFHLQERLFLGSSNESWPLKSRTFIEFPKTSDQGRGNCRSGSSTTENIITRSKHGGESWHRPASVVLQKWRQSKEHSISRNLQFDRSSFQYSVHRRASDWVTPPPTFSPFHHRGPFGARLLRGRKLRAFPDREEPTKASGSKDTFRSNAEGNASDVSRKPPPNSTKGFDATPSVSSPNANSLSEPPASDQTISSSNSSSSGSSKVPDLNAGVNWYCLSMIGLVSLIDFSPLGPILRSTSGSAVPWILAAVQWGLFVAPTISSCRTEGYDLRKTFGLKWCRPLDVLASAAAGASLWAVVTAAIAARVAADGGQLPSSESVVIADLLFSRPTNAAEWASLLTSAGVSPGIAEELLFRGFLLTALRQGLGRVDAVVLCAALFGLFHLSVPQFFPTTVLGIAAGVSAVASGSVVGPIAVHTAHNIAALLHGGVAPGDASGLPAPIVAVSVFTLAVSGTYLLLRARTGGRVG